MRKACSLTRILVTLALCPLLAHAASRTPFTMAQVLHYPYVTELAAAEHADAIAWVRDLEGVRNIWFAHGPDFAPVQITRYAEDDGQEITQLTFSPDGTRLVYGADGLKNRGEVTVVDLRTGQIEQLTHSSAYDGMQDWH